MNAARVLYLTYDGLTDPLGQSQVLPYLKGLAALGHRITIISCEKPDARARRGRAVADECAAAGIEWHPLDYRKSPPVLSTLRDLADMRRLARRLHRQSPFDIVHCRSYLTGLIGHAMQRDGGPRFLFDMRGFWIDERFERGIWSERNALYRLIARWLRGRERAMFAGADAVVSLTHAARDELARRGGEDWRDKTQVIPCCADLDHFSGASVRRVEGRAMLGLDEETPVALVLGSLGGAYPMEPVRAFFDRWSKDRTAARLLFVTRHDESEVRRQPALRDLGDRMIVRCSERADMPALIGAADVGLSFILPSFCAIASSPTKVGEMLAMGIPVVANDQVGDMARVMAEPGAGVLVADLSDASAAAGAGKALGLSTDPAAARAVAERWFALGEGVATYDHIYRTIMEVPRP